MTKKIVCFGDSITNGHDGECGRLNECLQARLNEWKNGEYICINRGHNGNTTANALDRFETDVLNELPATVLIEFGVNDCNRREWTSAARISLSEFERNLREFHRLICKKGSKCIFLTNHIVEPLEGSRFKNQGNGKTYTENLLPYNQRIRELANELNVDLIDVGGYITDNNIDPQELLREDGVHLSENGYRIYSDFAAGRLKEILD